MDSKVTFSRGIGTSSILMIFVVLCLTTFGILSFVTVKADYALTTKNAQSVQEYYEADAETDKLLQVIDTKLLEAKTAVLSEDKDEEAYYYLILSTALSGIENLTISEASDDLGTAYLQGTITIPINTIEQLQVVFNIDEMNAKQRYTVISHRKLTTDKWEEQDDGLNVWQG